jgi:thrombospondin type 3 repeat protein
MGMSRRCAELGGWLFAGAAFALALAVAASPARAACVDPPNLIGTISSPLNAAVAQLGPGSTYYIDDSLAKLVQVPPEFACAQWIKTANIDASNTDPGYLSFQLLERAEVHVLYDRRVAIEPERTPPTWLTSQFTYDSTVVDVDASDPSSTVADPDMDFVVYRKQFPAGTVTLGGNAAAGADFSQGGVSVSSNYIVVVTKPRPPIPTVSCSTPPTLISGITPPPSGNSYVAANLVAGTGTSSQYYTDRTTTHLLTQLPRQIACAQWLKTPNNDKLRTDAALPSFNVSQPSVAYVLYDTREALQGQPLPAWLTAAGFAYTHRIADITEPDRDQEFALFAKKVPAGTLVLGGNSQPPATANSMYVVAVAPDADGDGIPDVTDNCPNVPNTAQPDTDLDGLGDQCDPVVDSFGYRMTVDGGPDGPAFKFDDISTTGTAISLTNDSVSGAIALPFPFKFYGVARTNYFVSSNGFITFLASQPNGCCSGQITPSATTPQALVAGYWEDLNPGPLGVTRQTLGTAPHRVLVVQFTNVPHNPSGNAVTFEFKLFEGTNEIEVHYLSAPSDGGTHSAGIENDTGTVGLSFLFGNASLNGRAVRYSPNRRVAVRGFGTGMLAPGTTVLPVEVPNAGPVLDADLQLELKQLDDLGYITVDNFDVSLEHGTTTIQVFDGLGSFIPAHYDLVLDDEAAAPPPHNQTDTAGRFQPEPGLLSSFDGLASAGEWRLRITGFPAPDEHSILTTWTPRLLVDATGDSDGDGIIDQRDNCPDQPNAGQADFDGDGKGDICDISDDSNIAEQPNQAFDPANYRWTQGQAAFAPDFQAPPNLALPPGVCFMHSITTNSVAIGYDFTSTPPPNGFECCTWQAECGSLGCQQNVCAPSVVCQGSPTDPPCCRFNTGVQQFSWGNGQGAISPTDSDGDGRVDTCDSFPHDKHFCSDVNHDNCDDCSSGTFDPAHDQANCLPEPGAVVGLSTGVALIAALARRRRIV